MALAQLGLNPADSLTYSRVTPTPQLLPHVSIELVMDDRIDTRLPQHVLERIKGPASLLNGRRPDDSLQPSIEYTCFIQKLIVVVLILTPNLASGVTLQDHLFETTPDFFEAFQISQIVCAHAAIILAPGRALSALASGRRADGCRDCAPGLGGCQRGARLFRLVIRSDTGAPNCVTSDTFRLGGDAQSWGVGAGYVAGVALHHP